MHAEVVDLMERQRIFESARGLWEEWEIHCLILLSLFLQVFLFLAAGIRKRSSSSSWVLRTVLWLAYLSADSVAVLVLGHLAVPTRRPSSRQLMFFWAPFVLVHLGGQDTITAFSKEDNDLWNRHLLNLAIQAVVAGYVVAKTSWPDWRLRAAMVLMFLSGCFKYAERTICLFASSPAWLRSLSILTYCLEKDEEVIEGGICEFNHFATLEKTQTTTPSRFPGKTRTSTQIGALDQMKNSWSWIGADGIKAFVIDIMTTDAPLRVLRSTKAAEDYPPPDDISTPDPKSSYEFVAASLEHCYQYLYTKNPVRCTFYKVLESTTLFSLGGSKEDTTKVKGDTFSLGTSTLCLLFTLFQYVATLIALVLFTTTKKGDRDHHSSNNDIRRADITVSYILLVGALVLDVSSAAVYILSRIPEDRVIRRATMCLANYIQPARCRKQWSQELAQYSMIKRQDMALAWQWIRGKLSILGAEFSDVTHIPLSEGIKESIFKKLIEFRNNKEWNIIASSRGQRALTELPNPDSYPMLHWSTSTSVDFPTSVLIWHIATDMCYYSKDDTNGSGDQVKMSRELSNYIMYLVFKCGVKLTNHSQIEHDRTRGRIGSMLPKARLSEKEVITKLRGKLSHKVASELSREEEAEITDSRSSVLRNAHEVASELTRIDDETKRWGLITSVWSEMLFYTVPRCGAAFHYVHLATGGELATHVLLLMKFLGA